MADLVVDDTLVIGGADARTISRTLGGTVTAGQLVYVDPADSKAKLAQANAISTAKLAGVLQNGGSLDQPGEIQFEGDYDPGVAVVAGTTYVLSAAAAGGIAPIADLVSSNVSSILGTADATDNIKLGILNSEVLKT